MGEVSASEASSNSASSDTPGDLFTPPVTRSQLEAIRDEWLAPLVAQIAEQAMTIGRLEERLEHERRRVADLEARLTADASEKDELIARLHRRIADLAEELDAAETSARHDAVDDLQARVSALEDATAAQSNARGAGWRFWSR